MTLPELQSCLDHLGVTLSLRLVVDAPAGVLTPEVRSALADHKPALLGLLVGVETESSPPPSAPTVPPWPPRAAELAGWPVEWRGAGRVVQRAAG